MKYFIAHLFSPKALLIQKRYLQMVLYKPFDKKIREFICWIDEMVEYLEKFLPFGIGQGLSDNDVCVCVCVCVCYRPPVHLVFPNHEVVGFQPRTVTDLLTRLRC